MKEKSSLQISDDIAAKGATHPRVTLNDIHGSIAAEYVFTADKATDAVGAPAVDSLKLLTICILVLKNGFTVIGKSAPASPENFDAKKGATFAKEDAIRQIWPLAGYALRERLTETSAKAA